MRRTLTLLHPPPPPLLPDAHLRARYYEHASRSLGHKYRALPLEGEALYSERFVDVPEEAFEREVELTLADAQRAVEGGA